MIPNGARAARLDAWLWGLGSALVLLAIPVGLVTGDALGQTARAAGGFSPPNPNHLLLEPLGVLTLRATAAVAPGLPAVDRLRWLGAVAGALAVAIFRAGIAPRFAPTRAVANYATAWMALSPAFSHVWLSAECHAIQMPAVAAAAIALLRLRARSGIAAAVALGVAIAGATLCFASLALLMPFAWLALRAASGRRPPAAHAAAAIAGFLALLAPTVTLVWWSTVEGHGPGLASWLTSYGGGGHLGRLREVYGAPPSLGGLAEAAARAAYGAAGAVVDLMPAVAGWRDRGEVAMPLVRMLLAAAAACSLAAGFPRRRDDRLLLVVLLAPPTLLFAWLWNNSEEQFHLPLAIVVGVLAASSARSRTATALGLVILAWNTADLAHRFVLYPRESRLAELADATAGSCLVVFPGFDEPEVLLGLGAAPAASERLSLTTLAVSDPPERGLPRLRAAIDRARERGCSVALVDVLGRPPFAPPWKFLRGLGYTPEAVRRALGGLAPRAAAPAARHFEVLRVLPAP